MDRRAEQINKFIPAPLRVAAIGVAALGSVVYGRVAHAENISVNPVVYTSDCKPENSLNISVPDFEYCPRPNEALIYATSIIYKESNGRKGYQKDEDRVTGLHVGATYTMRNTANSSETYEVIVNEKGELSRVIEIDGKKVEQTVFVFTADPNTSPYRAANNQPAVEVEFRRHGAWDVDKKEYVLGDPVKAYTALGCTALNYGLRLEERYLGPEDKPVPANTAPQPLVPPVQLPRSGDGSTRTPDLRNLPHITPWPGNGR